VTLDDSYSASFAAVGNTSSLTGTTFSDLGGGQFQWTGIDLAAGASATFTLSGTVPSTLTGGAAFVDLITADTASDTLSVLLGRGHGDFAPAVAIPVGRQPRTVIAADLDGDGLVDLAVTNGGDGNVSLLYQTRGKSTPCRTAAAEK